MALALSRINQLKEFSEKFTLNFKNLELLNQALTHCSYAVENRHLNFFNNERLEFLGDAVLKLVVSTYLYKNFSNKDEGFLTKIRSRVISDSNLAEVAGQNHLGKYLLLSRNEQQNGGRERKSNLANALEALFGAAFLDSGVEQAKKVILNFMGPTLAEYSASNDLHDYKSQLQEQVQALGWKLPEYRVIQELGPEHNKVFRIQVKIGKNLKKIKEEGSGRTKKEAEQNAAAKILQVLKNSAVRS
jgi:ribonuclease-3